MAHRSINEVTDLIAEPEQIGGGGIAAALSAALGISAAELVLRLAQARRSMQANRPQIDAHLAALAAHRAALTLAADEEVDILARLLELWPQRNDPTHAADYIAALEAAIDSPLRAVQVISAAATHIRDGQQYATSFTESDMIAGLAMLDGATRAFVVTALVNVDLLARADPERNVDTLRQALLAAQDAVSAAYRASAGTTQ